MLKLRTDVAYVSPTGRMTQAGVEAIQGQLDEKATSDSVTAVSSRVTTLENIEAGNVTRAPGSAPRYFPRAWVNFNGTGTVAIRASGNVSSITDNGVGNYTVNFLTAMPDANYAASVFGSDEANVGIAFPFSSPAPAAGSFGFIFSNPANGTQRADKAVVLVTVTR